MPIFEYRCEKCDSKFEELVTGDRDRLIPCPSCGSESTEKLLSAIGGIAMGSSQPGGCGSSCPGISSCSTGGGCPCG